MDIQFYDNGDHAPKPNNQVKIEEVELVVYPDRFRVYCHVRVTPFQERPNLMLVMRDDDDQIASELNVIETMHNDMEFTLHVRGKTEPMGTYTLSVDLFYETRNPPQDRHIEVFEIPSQVEADAHNQDDQP